MARSPAWLCLLGFAVACGPAAPRVEFAGPPGSAEPNVTLSKSGAAVLTWLEPVASGRHALRLATRTAGAWSSPETIVESDSFFVNWADFPSALSLGDGTLVVHWLAKVPGGKYGYHVRAAIRRPGAPWSPPITIHRDRSAQEHGFVAMTAIDDSTAGLAWLDGGAMKGGDGEHESTGDMAFRFTTLTASGRLGDEAVLDARTCECCQTALVASGRTLIAAYRDRSPTEIRDIAVVRRVDGVWSQPITVAADNWEYHGCPVNGPALAALADTIALAWYAAPGGVARVWATWSVDGGVTWVQPVRVDDGLPIGRVDVEIVLPAAVVVTWLEGGDRATVRARRIERHAGRSWEVAPSSAARASGFPRILRAGAELLFAWTSDQGVRVAAQPVPR